jgi:hypothetical protein
MIRLDFSADLSNKKKQNLMAAFLGARAVAKDALRLPIATVGRLIH